MQWPEPAYTEQSLARLARPTKGGAVRIRIALGTAVAVIAIPAIFFAFFSSSSAASARLTRHEAINQHRTVKLNDTLMSYAQARSVSQMVTYANAVESGQVKTYLTEIAYLKQVATQRQQAAAQAAAAAAAAPRARPVAAPAPAPAPAPDAGASDATSTNTADWACIRQHESGDNYASGNGGAYQFELGTWSALTGYPSPAEDYPAAVQDAAALKLYAERGWEPWTTRDVCGL
jgi:Transglycosylase-like domain